MGVDEPEKRARWEELYEELESRPMTDEERDILTRHWQAGVDELKQEIAELEERVRQME